MAVMDVMSKEKCLSFAQKLSDVISESVSCNQFLEYSAEVRCLLETNQILTTALVMEPKLPLK